MEIVVAGSDKDPGRNRPIPVRSDTFGPQEGDNPEADQESPLRRRLKPLSPPKDDETTPLDVYKSALGKGGPESIANQKSRIETLELENSNLKDDNRMLREKVDELNGRIRDHLKMTRSSDKEEVDDLYHPGGGKEGEKVMGVHLKKLNSTIESLQEENEELRLKLVAKQLDLDNIQKQIDTGSANPLFFAQEKTRHDFWKIMTRIQAEQASLQEEKSKYLGDLYKYKAKCTVYEQELEELRQNKEIIERLQEEKIKLFEQVSELSDQSLEQEHVIRTLMIKLKNEEARSKQFEGEKNEVTKFSLLLKSQLQEQHVKSTNDKQLLSEGLKELRSQKQKINEINDIRKEKSEIEKRKTILPTNAAVKQNKQVLVSDYFVRLKTTTVHHQKYADTIDILVNLVENEEQQVNALKQREGVKPDQIMQARKIAREVAQPLNYRVLLKGVGSKNQTVLLAVHRILMCLGDLDVPSELEALEMERDSLQIERARLVHESGAAKALIAQYINNENMFSRKLVLDIMIPVLSMTSGEGGQVARAMAMEMVKAGGLKRVVNDIKNFVLVDHGQLKEQSVQYYVESVLRMVANVIKFGDGLEGSSPETSGRRALMEKEFLSNFKVCCSIKSLTAVLQDSKGQESIVEDHITMFILATKVARYLVHADLPNHTENQIVFSEYDIFNSFFTGLILSHQQEEYEMMAECLITLSMFLEPAEHEEYIQQYILQQLNQEAEAKPEDKKQTNAYQGLLMTLESMMPHFWVVVSLMIPELTPKEALPYLSPELKVALTRFMRYIILPSNFRVLQSKDKGFSQVHFIKFLLHGIKDKSDPPHHKIALKSMKLMSDNERLIADMSDNFDVFVDFVNYLTRWIGNSDQHLVEAALTCLVMILQNEKGKLRFIEIGGLSFLINCMANANVRIAESMGREKKNTYEYFNDLGLLILKRSLQITEVLVKTAEARKYLMKANLISPLLNFINSKNPFIINQWYDILAELCTYPEFSAEMAHQENLHTLLYRALSSANDKTNESLVTFLSTLSRNDRLIQKVVTLQSVKPLIAQIGQNAEQNGLHGVSLIYHCLGHKKGEVNKDGEEQPTIALAYAPEVKKLFGNEILNSASVMKMLMFSLCDESQDYSSMASTILIHLLKDSKPSRRVLDKIGFYESLKRFEKIGKKDKDSWQRKAFKKLVTMLKDYGLLDQK